MNLTGDLKTSLENSVEYTEEHVELSVLVRLPPVQTHTHTHVYTIIITISSFRIKTLTG